jgi:peptidoglycan hydrolase-like protein with peptidoglycan-binding domain
MNITLLLSLLPLALKAIELAQQISAANKSGEGLGKIIESQGGQVLELITQAGATLFPNLSGDKQIAAGALRFDHETTLRIQKQLNKLGAKLEADGYYGNATKAAVTEFQKANGLTVDGWAGKNTQAALNAKAPE